MADRPPEQVQRVERRLTRVQQWLEATGVPRDEAAPRERLLEVAARVEEWLRARRALDLHASLLTPENLAWLRALPYKHVVGDTGVHLCHAPLPHVRSLP